MAQNVLLSWCFIKLCCPDLVRNDIGRIATVGSVSVPALMKVESYATVHQLVSTVRAHIREDTSVLDAGNACVCVCVCVCICICVSVYVCVC